MHKTYKVEVYKDGSEHWFLDGKYHRENDLPAVTWTYGTEEWWMNGTLHRENGPAISYPDGSERWFLDGNEYTKSKFNAKMNPPTKMTVEEIQEKLGYKIEIVEG
jgi:hypothetical protein